MSGADAGLDRMHAASNACLEKLLSAAAEVEGTLKEQILYSGEVVKINRKGARQHRVLLITDHAVYNFRDAKFKAYQRRIDIQKLEHIYIVEGRSTELVLVGASARGR